MSYSTKCIGCKVIFTKRSNKAKSLCPDCEPKRTKTKNKYLQAEKLTNKNITAQARLPSQMHNLEMRMDELEKSKEITYDAVMIEMRMNMKEMIKEIIEAYLFDTRKLIDDNQKETGEMIQKELKETKFKTHGSLATINSRMKKHFNAIEHDVQRIFKKTKIKLGTSANKERENRYGRR